MDVAGFDEWYRREHGRLVNSLYLLSGSLDAATDATDEAFARAAARWPRVREMERPAGWTYAVGLNVLRTTMRRHGRRTPHDRELSAETPVPQPEIWKAVADLPERQRLATILRYVGDLTEPDIALAMGISRGAVASSLARARATLAESLAETEG